MLNVFVWMTTCGLPLTRGWLEKNARLTSEASIFIDLIHFVYSTIHSSLVTNCLCAYIIGCFSRNIHFNKCSKSLWNKDLFLKLKCLFIHQKFKSVLNKPWNVQWSNGYGLTKAITQNLKVILNVVMQIFWTSITADHVKIVKKAVKNNKNKVSDI